MKRCKRINSVSSYPNERGSIAKQLEKAVTDEATCWVDKIRRDAISHEEREEQVPEL
jgi:hypothetical protein